MNESLTKLSIRLGITFSDPGLLSLAMTHRSYAGNNNERLEFLGDAILGMLIAEALYERFPRADEGQLSRLRAKLVRRDTLADVARDFDLGDFLLLGPGELKSGGFGRSSTLCNAFEALVGAIYLDQGMRAIRERIAVWFHDRIASLSCENVGKDAKTTLQEYLQSRGMDLPQYEIVKTVGQSHNQVFHVECSVSIMAIQGTGMGTSRRAAEQQAAAQAMTLLKPATNSV